MILRTATIATLAVASLATCATAQDTRGAREACREDYKKFCASVTPGGGRAKQCLTENLGKLAQACKEVMTSSQLKPKS